MVAYFSEGWWFDSQLLHSACQCVFGQDAEPQIAHNDCSISEYVIEFLMSVVALCGEAICS